MSVEHESEPGGDNEEFSFLQETIKKEPVNKKKLAEKIAKMAGLGLVFGIAASLGFFALKPWAESRFYNNSNEVTIPKDEADTKVEEEEADPPEALPPALTLDSYRQMNQALYAVAQEADKCVVEVTGVHADEVWMKKSYDAVNSVTGLIVANTGRQFLILGKSSVLVEAESLTVTFSDGSKCNAILKKKDENTGMAVISVDLADVGENTKNQVKTAVLGNSNALRRGEPLIALGKVHGYSGGVGYGIVSSMKNEVVLADGQYGLICTDIAGTPGGTGVLVNLSGEVVGIIDQTVGAEENTNLTAAFAISDLKEEVELLSNGASVPYVGIIGTDVTDAAIQTEGLPSGIYVKEVQADSPAMAAGIQSGDVITNFDGERVATVSGYYGAVMKSRADQVVKISGQRRGANGYVSIEFNVTIGSKQ